MSERFAAAEQELRASPRRWLVTGGAGFIGSHLVERLLRLGQEVVVLDNLSTGHRSNLEAAARQAPPPRFVEGDLRDPTAVREAMRGVHRVLHQAALGSVPRSIADPVTSHAVNDLGFLHVLNAARDAGVERLVYASSSSVYGDHPALPKREEAVGRPLSPYAATKRANEGYAQAFAAAYGLTTVGLRYFNVFGPRQDPEGPYAAVIPRWFKALASGHRPVLFGDGQTSRDFCYVANVVQANLLAATVDADAVRGEVLNVACGGRTTLSELLGLIRDLVAARQPAAGALEACFEPARTGDIRHSLADIGRARALLGYQPTHQVAAGLAEAAAWYLGEAWNRSRESH